MRDWTTPVKMMVSFTSSEAIPEKTIYKLANEMVKWHLKLTMKQFVPLRIQDEPELVTTHTASPRKRYSVTMYSNYKSFYHFVAHRIYLFFYINIRSFMSGATVVRMPNEK